MLDLHIWLVFKMNSKQKLFICLMIRSTEGEFKGVGKRGGGNVQLARILQYLECPQYLRKSFFPQHKDFSMLVSQCWCYVFVLHQIDKHLKRLPYCLVAKLFPDVHIHYIDWMIWTNCKLFEDIDSTKVWKERFRCTKIFLFTV